MLTLPTSEALRVEKVRINFSLSFIFSIRWIFQIYTSLITNTVKNETDSFGRKLLQFLAKVANNRDLELAAGRVISSLESRGRHLLEGKGEGGGGAYFSFLKMPFVFYLF